MIKAGRTADMALVDFGDQITKIYEPITALLGPADRASGARRARQVCSAIRGFSYVHAVRQYGSGRRSVTKVLEYGTGNLSSL